MARSGLNLAWADHPVTLNGARSIGRALNGLSIELPVGLVEAESALGALVSADLATLTDVEPSAGLALALATRATAPALAEVKHALATRVARPLAIAQDRPLPLSPTTPATPEKRRHLEAVPSSGLPVASPTPRRPRDAATAPPWRHLSTAGATTRASLVGTPDLVRMASPRPRRTASAPTSVDTPRRASGEPARTALAPAKPDLEGNSPRTPVGAEQGRRGRRARLTPTTLDDGRRSAQAAVEDTPRERSAARSSATAPQGQGLAALMEAWHHTNGDAAANPEADGDAQAAATIAPRPDVHENGAARGLATVAAPSLLAERPAGAAEHWDPVAPSDLDTEAMLLDVLARALHTEARRYGIEPDGWPR